MASHTIMPKKLAQALMDAGMHHFDSGGMIGGAPALGIPQAFGANVDNPSIAEQNYAPQIGLLQQRQTDVYNQQQNLANALLNQSNGQGPSPAQMQLAQNTGTNMQHQAALMAGQRGAGANAGLMARQAAQQGAGMQQQSTGQAATLGAQQQLGAQQALQQQQSMMANQALQGESIQQGGQAAQNASLTTGQLGASMANAQQAGGIMGGLIGAGGSIIGGMMSKGGMVKKMADGGLVNDNLGIAKFDSAQPLPSMGGGQQGGGIGGGIGLAGGALGKYLAGGEGASSLGTAGPWETGGGLAGGFGDAMGMGESGFLGAEGGGLGEVASGLWGGAAGMGEVAGAGAAGVGAGATAPAVGEGVAVVAPALVEEGAMVAYKGGKIPFSKALLKGGSVPGSASVKGDSQENDTQPTLLSPGEVVLPRSVTMSKDPAAKAAEFMKHLKSKKGSYEDVKESRKKKA